MQFRSLFVYDDFSDLTEYTALLGLPAARSPFVVDYARDAAGRISTITERTQGASVVIAYAYDPSGRLTEITRDGAGMAKFEYDSNGNRLTETLPTGTTFFSYDDQDRLTRKGEAQYEYTADGDLEKKSELGAVTTYSMTYSADWKGYHFPMVP